MNVSVDTEVIKVSPQGFIFPEDIWLYNYRDEWLYAFGKSHIWRTADGEEWELVK